MRRRERCSAAPCCSSTSTASRRSTTPSAIRRATSCSRRSALRLRAALRDSDTIARLGGDEFGVLLPGLGHARGAAERGARRSAPPSSTTSSSTSCPVHIDASVGIALYPEHGDDVDMLLQHADVAMYDAKRKPTGYEVYSRRARPLQPGPARDGRGAARGRSRRTRSLLHYQPKIDLESGEVVGAEALVRWQHPTRGLLRPAEFVPMAERTGLIKPLSRYVLNIALCAVPRVARRGARPERSRSTSPPATCSTRVFPRTYRDCSHGGGPCPHRLELEITESTMMVDPDSARCEVLRRLHDIGIALSIDDFGTGYSSLAYLKEPAGQRAEDRPHLRRGR